MNSRPAKCSFRKIQWDARERDTKDNVQKARPYFRGSNRVRTAARRRFPARPPDRTEASGGWNPPEKRPAPGKIRKIRYLCQKSLSTGNNHEKVPASASCSVSLAPGSGRRGGPPPETHLLQYAQQRRRGRPERLGTPPPRHTADDPPGSAGRVRRAGGARRPVAIPRRGVPAVRPRGRGARRRRQGRRDHGDLLPPRPFRPARQRHAVAQRDARPPLARMGRSLQPHDDLGGTATGRRARPSSTSTPTSTTRAKRRARKG